jgi:hypothetical protein
LKNVSFYVITFSILLLISFSTFSCKSDSTNPVTNNNPTYDANTINGTVTFADTTYITDTTAGKYYVAAFATWPGNPTATSRIYPVKSGGKYTANYKIQVTNSGNYVVATAWVILPPPSAYKSWFLGVFDVAGKDTSSAAIWGTHPTANITNGAGVGNINFNSYIDTAHRIAVFP